MESEGGGSHSLKIISLFDVLISRSLYRRSVVWDVPSPALPSSLHALTDSVMSSEIPQLNNSLSLLLLPSPMIMTAAVVRLGLSGCRQRAGEGGSGRDEEAEAVRKRALENEKRSHRDG
jgi:hypothetical protein